MAHYERLSALDALFLDIEDASSHVDVCPRGRMPARSSVTSQTRLWNLSRASRRRRPRSG
jgi:hypothetical protein